MNFHEKLNEYIQMLSCTAKELSELSGLSAATLSRYRSGERVPDMRSSTFSQLCSALPGSQNKREIPRLQPMQYGRASSPARILSLLTVSSSGIISIR